MVTKESLQKRLKELESARDVAVAKLNVVSGQVFEIKVQLQAVEQLEKEASDTGKTSESHMKAVD